LKDARRRKLYKNCAINGRYELSDKEDSTLSVCAVYNEHKPNVRMVEWIAQRKTIHPSKLHNGIGHWAEFPKNQKYGRYGWNLKSAKHKRLRQAYKIKMRKELEE
jgi:hypothetical protein